MSGHVVKQIADELGVTPRTVRRVLTEPLRDTRPTIVARVRSIQKRATELGYRPNAAASAIRTGRFGSIGTLWATTGAGAFGASTFHETMHRELARRHLSLLTGMVHMKAGEEDRESLPMLLRRACCDAMMVSISQALPGWLQERIDEMAVPTLYLNQDRPINTVRPGDQEAALEVGQMVVERGHRRIAWVQLGPALNYSVRHRRLGVEQALDAAGLRPQRVEAPQQRNIAGNGEGPRLLREVLAGSDRPTAVIAYNEKNFDLVCGAAWSLGLRVPEDLSVLTFGPTHLTALGQVLSGAVIHHHKMAEAAIAMLDQVLAAPDDPVPTHVVPLEICTGDTLSNPLSDGRS